REEREREEERTEKGETGKREKRKSVCTFPPPEGCVGCFLSERPLKPGEGGKRRETKKRGCCAKAVPVQERETKERTEAGEKACGRQFFHFCCRKATVSWRLRFGSSEKAAPSEG
ncbi:hypothetical protein TGFOU_402760, partial [Toxoplasma gondii FOU]